MSTAVVDQDPAATYRLPVDRVLEGLGPGAGAGLTLEEAQARLARYGKNELIAEKHVPRWKKFLAQFKEVLVILLLVATAISAALWVVERDTALPYEALAIFAVVLLNAIMGHIQR